jgi:adenylate cyclase, class 2
MTGSLMHNVELKARCADLARAASVSVGMGAREVGLLIQTDIYFNARKGRLKLRLIEPAGQAELIWYDRPDSVESRLSDYTVTPVTDYGLMNQTLASALGVRGTVRKKRRLLLWENVRIHLDEVEGLGTFVEFEAVLSAGELEAAGHDRIARLARAIGIRESERLGGSYSDLMGM